MNPAREWIAYFSFLYLIDAEMNLTDLFVWYALIVFSV